MAPMTIVLAAVLLIYVLLDFSDADGRSGLQRCKFPAIYNFGDSNSDTGGGSAALKEIPPPNGETYFHKPSGRACDGRLIIDFIAESLRLPYLSAYLDSVATNFRHGANFAVGGSSIRIGGFSPIHLAIQISQFAQFKARSTKTYNKLHPRGNLPRPEDFSKALYIFDIGQNDLAYGFQHTTEEEVLKSIPDILRQLIDAMQRLYKEGAKAFWIHNTGPVGCLPYAVIYSGKTGNMDKHGCVESQNRVAQEFNRQLGERIAVLRVQLPDATFTYVDVYSEKYALISKAAEEGFANPFEFCCGSYYGYHIDCGKTATVNGTLYGLPCPDPSKYISWDGIHYTEAANRWTAIHILNGSSSTPPVPIQKACPS